MIFTSLFSAENKISQKTFKLLKEVQKLNDEKKYNKALAILKPFIKKTKNPQAKLYAYQSLANIYINKDNYEKVAKIYIKIIKLDILENKDLDKMKYSLSQIYLSSFEYKKSLKYSFEIINSLNVKKALVVKNIALAYYYDKQYKKASVYINKTITYEKKKESWYRMLYSSYVEIKEYTKAINTLKYMTSNYSKNETYWMQLIYLYQKTRQSKKTLATMELAYKNNFVNQKDNILYYIDLLVKQSLYNKVSIVMKDSLDKKILKNTNKNFDILLSSYLNSKNYINAIKELKNSKFSNTDKYKLMLANIYYNKDKYKKTIRLLKSYKFKKFSRNEGKKYILLALCSHELESPKDLKKYIRKARRNKYEKYRAEHIIKSLKIKI